jgi:hypothetical protein
MPKTFLSRLFPHDLKLIVDYNLNPAAIDGLNKLGSVKAKRTTDYGFSQGADDKDLVYNKDRAVLLTGDFESIDEITYPPCQHEGIILLREKRASPEKIVSCLKAFCQSGHRKKTSHNVIHLWEKKAIIHKHDKEVEEVQL